MSTTGSPQPPPPDEEDIITIGAVPGDDDGATTGRFGGEVENGEGRLRRGERERVESVGDGEGVPVAGTAKVTSSVSAFSASFSVLVTVLRRCASTGFYAP